MGYRKYDITVEIKNYQDDGYSKEVGKLVGGFKLNEPILFNNDEDIQLVKEILSDAIKTLKQRLEEKNIEKEDDIKDLDDTEEPDDMDYDEESEECEYDASASFIADIEYEFTLEDQEIDKQKIFRMVENFLDDADVYIEEYIEDDITIKHIKDNEYKLVLKNVNFSTSVTVTGYSYDQCNDDRWSAFWEKVDGIECLTNVHDEDVSEVD